MVCPPKNNFGLRTAYVHMLFQTLLNKLNEIVGFSEKVEASKCLIYKDSKVRYYIN